MKINEIDCRFRELKNSVNLLIRLHQTGFPPDEINQAFESKYVVIWEGQKDKNGIAGCDQFEDVCGICADAESDDCSVQVYRTSDMQKAKINKQININF